MLIQFDNGSSLIRLWRCHLQVSCVLAVLIGRRLQAQPDACPVDGLQRLHAALRLKQAELLQRHIRDTLREAAGSSALPHLLMADWVTLHVQERGLRSEELLPLAAAVYSSAGTPGGE